MTKEIYVPTKEEIEELNEKRKRYAKEQVMVDFVAKDLLKLANVVGVSVSRKVKGGIILDEPCITVTVTKKQNVSGGDKIPSKINGIQTDVVEQTGEFSLFQDRTVKLRPFPGGMSVGLYTSTSAGTVGCCVYPNNSPTMKCGLTNAHVLSYALKCNNTGYEWPRCNTAQNWVTQPGPYDGGGGGDICGWHFDYTPRAVAYTPSVDASIFSCADIQPDTIADISLPYGLNHTPNDVFPGDPVIKSGRTTGVTTGKVVAINAYMGCYVKNCANADVQHTWRDQIQTTEMGASGDSGSILLHNNYAKGVVGLLMGGGNGATFFNKFQNVMDQLDINLG